MLLFLFAFVLPYDEPVTVNIFTPGDEDSKFYRIPAIVTAPNGSFVVATDRRKVVQLDLPNPIDVVIKTSHDGGLTWGATKLIAGNNPKGYGDSALIVDKQTGNILCLFNGNNGFFQSTSTDPIRNYLSISKDNGETWSEPKDITYMLYGAECDHPERQTWDGMFLTSGAGHQLRSGRLMVVGVVRKHLTAGLFNYVVYSDDHGETWDVGISPATSGGDESKVIELNNGDVMMSIRHKPYRFQAISHDKGLTFDPQENRPDMVDPACNGDIIRYTSTKDGYDKDRILFVNDHHPSLRENVSIKVSYDEGKTWAYSKVIYPGDAWYSAATIRQDGMIAVYFERVDDQARSNMDLMLMSLEWITDGADKYIPPDPTKAAKRAAPRRYQVYNL